MVTTFVRPPAAAPLIDRSILDRGRALRSLGLVGLAALVTFVYLPVLAFDFVNWDDPWYVQQNPLIRSWHPENLWRIVSEFSVRNYAPVTTFSLLIDHTLWGNWAGGYHLTNVALHLTNVLLVYVLLAQVAGSRFVAWTAAALFAVHPVHLESVAWISSRKGLLSAAFILAALIAWLRPARTPRQEAAAIGFLILALLSKAVAVVVPVVMLAYDRLVRREPWSQALPRQIIPGFLSLILLLVTVSAQTSLTGGVREHLSLSLPEILALDAVILWTYAGMLLWPGELSVMYDVSLSGVALAAAAAFGWLAVGWRVWRTRAGYPLVALGALTSLLFLLPVLNLTPLTTLMNDRYLYLPSIPLFALAAAGFERLGRDGESGSDDANATLPRSGWTMSGRVLLVVAAVLAYGTAAKAHLPVWRDGLSLWRHASQTAPQLAVTQIELANALHANGDTSAAIAVLERALVHARIDEIDRRRIEAKLADWNRMLAKQDLSE